MDIAADKSSKTNNNTRLSETETINFLVNQVGMSEGAAQARFRRMNQPRGDIFVEDMAPYDRYVGQTSPGRVASGRQVARLEWLYDPGAIARRVSKLGEQITQDYACKPFPLCLVGAMTGSLVFAADLMRHIGLDAELQMAHVASHHGDLQRPSKTHVTLGAHFDIAGKEVLIVDDIVATGQTLQALVKRLKRYKPASLNICVLLDKPAHRLPNTPKVKYCGFEIPDKFVVGYGMDYNQLYRNLPYIGAVEFSTEEQGQFSE